MKHFAHRLTVLLTLALLPSITSAQTSVSAEVQNAMAKLAFLEGEWEGTGTITTGPNRKSEAKVHERGTFKLQKSVFLLEGTGVAEFPDGTQHHVHDAMGLISYDTQAKKYRFRTYRAGGEVLDPEIEVLDNKIVWSFVRPDSGNKIRFTLSVKDGVWTEIGEININGRWMLFFDMNLKRKR